MAVAGTPGWIHIVASGHDGTICLGVTGDRIRRAWQHRAGSVEGFTREHGCKVPAGFADRGSIEAARGRERQMKKWRRSWKRREREALNPGWEDLFPSLFGTGAPARAGA